MAQFTEGSKGWQLISLLFIILIVVVVGCRAEGTTTVRPKGMLTTSTRFCNGAGQADTSQNENMLRSRINCELVAFGVFGSDEETHQDDRNLVAEPWPSILRGPASSPLQLSFMSVLLGLGLSAPSP
jgi:hypothetical protein